MTVRADIPDQVNVSASGRIITLRLDGETKSIEEWSRHPDCPISSTTILRRLHSGKYSFQDAVFKKLGKPSKPDEVFSFYGEVREVTCRSWLR